MYRKLLVIATLAALGALAVGGAAFASGSNDHSGRTITVIEKGTSANFVDLGAKGPSFGDEFFFQSQLWNADKTRQVGTNVGYCVAQLGGVDHCQGTAKLAGGTIEWAGSVPGNAQRFRIAITGGSGAFREAEGQIAITNLNQSGSLSRDVIQLVG